MISYRAQTSHTKRIKTSLCTRLYSTGQAVKYFNTRLLCCSHVCQASIAGNPVVGLRKRQTSEGQTPSVPRLHGSLISDCRAEKNEPGTCPDILECNLSGRSATADGNCSHRRGVYDGAEGGGCTTGLNASILCLQKTRSAGSSADALVTTKCSLFGTSSAAAAVAVAASFQRLAGVSNSVGEGRKAGESVVNLEPRRERAEGNRGGLSTTLKNRRLSSLDAVASVPDFTGNCREPRNLISSGETVVPPIARAFRGRCEVSESGPEGPERSLARSSTGNGGAFDSGRLCRGLSSSSVVSTETNGVIRAGEERDALIEYRGVLKEAPACVSQRHRVLDDRDLLEKRRRGVPPASLTPGRTRKLGSKDDRALRDRRVGRLEVIEARDNGKQERACVPSGVGCSWQQEVKGSKRESPEESWCGKAVSEEDGRLVALLRQRPKHVPQVRHAIDMLRHYLKKPSYTAEDCSIRHNGIAYKRDSLGIRRNFETPQA